MLVVVDSGYLSSNIDFAESNFYIKYIKLIFTFIVIGPLVLKYNIGIFIVFQGKIQTHQKARSIFQFGV